MSQTACVRTIDVGRSFGDVHITEVLRNINIAIYPGEMVALMGPSGSGKSTLLNLVGLLDRPSKGVVEVNGQDTTGLDDEAITALRGDYLGFVFQFHHLLPGLTVLENVVMPKAAQLKRFDPALKGRGKELLAAMGLEGREHAWPRELSGGMQQRVAIARALMNQPPLVLADEPTGNLDTESGDQVFAVLEEQNRSEGTAFLIVTHDQSIADRCQRTIRIVDGAIAE